MVSFRFGWTDLYGGNRFLAPLSESALIEAGEAAGFQAGETLLDIHCGSGGASVFLAEEFHMYARGLDASREMVGRARERSRRSPAANRLRFFHADTAHGYGLVDAVCALQGRLYDSLVFLRPGARVLVGRYVLRRDDAPHELTEAFDISVDEVPGTVVWRRDASPMEWERFLRPQERVLRDVRDSSPIVDLGRRRIEAFRAHGACIAYELCAVRRE